MDNETTLSTERRRHPRYAGDQYPLRIGRHSGRLVDWSACGVGVMIKEGVESYAPGESLAISIPSERTMAVAVFNGCIQRIDQERGILGVEFLDEGEQAVQLLIDLIGTMLPDG